MGSVLVLVTIQLIAALAVANLVSRKDRPPVTVIAPLQGAIGKVLFLNSTPLVGQIPAAGMPGYSLDVEQMKNDAGATQQEANNVKARNVDSDWNLLAQAIDRIMFVSFLAIILIFLSAFVGGAASTINSMPSYGQPEKIL